jgi:hypothetical protein
MIAPPNTPVQALGAPAPDRHRWLQSNEDKMK